MVVDSTTTPTCLSMDVTTLFMWTSMFMDGFQLSRLFYTVFSSSKRRSTTGARISFTGGPSDYISFPSRLYLMLHFIFLEIISNYPLFLHRDQ
jgi:hypothetical protein